MPFTRGSSAATLVQIELQYIRELLSLREESHAVFFGDGPNRITFPYDKEGDYFVWIKVNAKDFGLNNHGTVHLFMSDKANTVTQAINLLSSSYDEFYTRLRKKKHLEHFFIAMRYTATEEFDFSSFLDLTDEMLGSN